MQVTVKELRDGDIIGELFGNLEVLSVRDEKVMVKRFDRTFEIIEYGENDLINIAKRKA